MPYELKHTTRAKVELKTLEDGGPAMAGKLRKVRRTLARLESNPRHPGLRSHEFASFPRFEKEKVWDSYVENNTPSAWRVFWMYGPDEMRDGAPVSVITVLAITPHP